jgi:hypothetical protein
MRPSSRHTPARHARWRSGKPRRDDGQAAAHARHRNVAERPRPPRRPGRKRLSERAEAGRHHPGAAPAHRSGTGHAPAPGRRRGRLGAVRGSDPTVGARHRPAAPSALRARPGPASAVVGRIHRMAHGRFSRPRDHESELTTPLSQVRATVSGRQRARHLSRTWRDRDGFSYPQPEASPAVWPGIPARPSGDQGRSPSRRGGARSRSRTACRTGTPHHRPGSLAVHVLRGVHP